MNVKPDDVEFYRENGYARVPGVFSHEDIDRVRSMVYRLYRNFVPDAPELDALAEPWNAPEWDQAMLALRERDANAFGALYDCAQSSLEMLQLLTVPNALDVAAAFLDDNPADLSYSGVMLRMDTPNDRRNVITWHQDHSYYPQNFNDGSRGLVYWIAMQDVTEDMGALHICPGSHKEGLLEPETTEKENYGSTEQRAVPEEAIARYPEVRGVCEKGDVLLMHMDTFHRSGFNTSDTIRYSAIFRFHRMLTDDYVPFGLLYQYNPYMIDRARAAQNS